MKSFIMGLIGVTVMIFGGWNMFQGQPAAQTSRQYLPPEIEPIQATTVNKLIGTWHAFPVGLILRFNDDGSAQFGLDNDGTASGYEATVRFESQLLSIQFTNYDGQNEACHKQAGLYTVQLHPGGQISFEPVHDNCLFRLENLRGSEEGSFRLMFHQVTN